MRPSHQLIGILPLLTMQNLHIWHVNEVTLGAEKLRLSLKNTIVQTCPRDYSLQLPISSEPTVFFNTYPILHLPPKRTNMSPKKGAI